MQKDNEEYSLTRQNLIPFYLIQDRIRDNFTKIEKFIAAQLAINSEQNLQITALKNYNTSFKQQINRKFIEQQKKINNEISADLQGRIIVAINKNMGSFTQRLEEKQKQISGISQTMQNKLENIKKQVLNEATKDSQKGISRQMQKLQKKLKVAMQETNKKSILPSKQTNNNGRPQSRGKELVLKSNSEEGKGGPESYFSQEWVIKIKELQNRTTRVEQFIVGFDKRFYQNMSSLRDSWKQFGEDVLETKRKLTAKQDQLKLQLLKLKAIRQFQGSPEEMEETFKTKISNKFTDVYQLISQVATRTDLQSEATRIKKTMSRHDGELSDLRQENAKNSDYFTFYINNSNTDDLSAQIKNIREDLMKSQMLTTLKDQKQMKKNDEIALMLNEVSRTIETQAKKVLKAQNQVLRLRQLLYKQMERIDIIQDSNKITPEKMAKIHNTLDIDFSPSEGELINKKKQDAGHNIAVKELRLQVNKLKDELFVLSNQNAEMEKFKKSLTGLQSKVQKIKIQSEEAVLSRKPWVCLSCDKNDKQKVDSDRLRRDMSKKKLSENKAALFTKEKSDKLIKLIPASEQKFEVYEKYRQKYLSDSIKLPDIYKQKIGDKQLLI